MQANTLPDWQKVYNILKLTIMTEQGGKITREDVADEFKKSAEELAENVKVLGEVAAAGFVVANDPAIIKRVEEWTGSEVTPSSLSKGSHLVELYAQSLNQRIEKLNEDSKTLRS